MQRTRTSTRAMMPSSPSPSPGRLLVAPLFSVLLLLLAWIPAPAAAADGDVKQPLVVYNQSTTYAYLGCYNETNDLPNSARKRALPDGINDVRPDTMTVPECLKFCASSTNITYKYAGLEYSRECWCSMSLSALSVHLDDAACNTPCDGNLTQACGGSWKLSVYQKLSGPGSRLSAPIVVWATLLVTAAGISNLL